MMEAWTGTVRLLLRVVTLLLLLLRRGAHGGPAFDLGDMHLDSQD